MPVQPEILRVPDTTTARIFTSSFPYNTLNTNRVRTCHLLGVCHLTCLGIDARVFLTIFRLLFLNTTVHSFVAAGAAGLSVVRSEGSGACVGVSRLMRSSVISTYRLDERGRQWQRGSIHTVSAMRRFKTASVKFLFTTTRRMSAWFRSGARS